MTTGRYIVTRMLRLCGAVNKGEPPAPDEAVDGLAALNSLIGSWANDGLMCFARVWENFPLTVGTGGDVYTIGSGGNFDTARPIQIVSAYVRQVTTDLPLEIIPDERYALIPVKGLSSIPTMLNYDNGFPLAKIRLDYAPSSALTLFLESEKPVTALTLDADITLPPGWERALVFNGAIEVQPEYGTELAPTVPAIANQSLGLLKEAVLVQRPVLSPALGGRYDGYIDRYHGVVNP